VKVIGYVRVSTDEQAYGIEAQKVAIENFCKIRNYELVNVFIDEGVSGSVSAFERSGFKQAIQFAKENNIKILVIYALDRLGRSFYDIFETLKKLEFDYGIQVISIREEFLQTLDPRIRALILSILSWASWYERYLIRERTRLAMQKVKDKIPAKYREILNDPVRVRRIKELFLIHKLSPYEIAQSIGVSYSVIKRVLVELGLLKPPENICPRCFHKLIYDEQYDTLYCKNCGYLKPKVESLNPSQNTK